MGQSGAPSPASGALALTTGISKPGLYLIPTTDLQSLSHLAKF